MAIVTNNVLPLFDAREFCFSRARSTCIFLELSFTAEAHELIGCDCQFEALKRGFPAEIRRNNAQSLVVDVASPKIRYQKYQAPPV